MPLPSAQLRHEAAVGRGIGLCGLDSLERFVSAKSELMHQEGGGDEDVVILFSLRPYSATKPIYEILDDDDQIASVMTFDDLKAVYQSLS